MESLTAAIDAFNEYFWYLVIALLVFAGVYFGVRTAVVQLRYVPEMFKSITEKPSDISEGKQGVSAFKAFTISAASRVGTGNVVGVAIAIATGGPGAVFWMWLFALLGGATAFVESTLAQVYKVRDEDSYRGGPAYYITKAFNARWLALVYVFAIVATYGFVFNAVQSNSIAAAVSLSFDMDTTTTKMIIGALMAVATYVVIFGGIRRIGGFTQVVVPIIAVAYILIGFIVVALNITEVPRMLEDIVLNAFGIREFAGATLGAVIMKGVQRGLFSNEAGMGSVPNAAATASVSHPAKQGLIQTLGVYFDTLVVCTITAFIILLAHGDYVSSDGGIELTQTALASTVGAWGIHFLTVVIIFLAFSSVIGNYYYGQSNIEFLTRSRSALTIYRVLVGLCVFGGALGTVPLVWSLADVFSGIMATINLIVIIPLGGVAVAVLKNFSEQRAKGHNPVFHRDDVPGLRGWDGMECWDGSDPLTWREEKQRISKT
ncbi:alanine/glycine:cation symporter family protein [Corynebacterium ciconiae]|uniref:alanine/glycine:cation symporter family protein n=1 Tax=Corynebacterium ciconiae TaxID=227319 RepID=UPI000374D441|nr:alanine/glycine:cation symporter family protein [Corynebacterium ciconiae]